MHDFRVFGETPTRIINYRVMKHFYVLAIRCSGCVPSSYYTFVIALLVLMPSLSFGQSVSGTVFKDFNANGSKENTATYNEPGMPGVRVVATDPAGTLLTVSYGGSNTATTSSGSYSVTNGTTGQVRLEFILPDGYTFAANAATGGTLLMFPTTATQNLAVNSPDDYWDRTNIPDPTYVIPCYVQGTITGAYNADPALVAFKQSANSPTGTFTNGSGAMFPSLDVPTDKSMPYQVNELGTVWGVAFNKKAQTYYMSTFAKRHSGVGPQGFGAIFTVRVSNLNTTATFSNKAFFNLEGVTAAQGGVLNFGTITRTTSSSSLNYIADTPNSPSYDLDAYAKVGRMSYGDIDFQESTQKLFATNLFQRSLLEIDASSDLSPLSAAALGSKVKSYTLSALSGAPTCPNGILRPWALKIYKEQGYIGLVCDASGSQNKADLRAYVMRFDPANVSAGLSPVLTINTSYRDFTQEWRPWSTSFSQTGVALPADVNQFIMNVAFSEPVVSDIEFDENNNMVIAMGNLAGHKLGFGNYLPVTDGRRTLIVPITHGDMLHACYNPASRSWSLENTMGDCGPNFTGGQNTRQGYSSDATSTTAPGEFYQDAGGDGSDESVMGALAKVMGTGNMLAPMVDPFPYGGTPGEGYFSTGGVHWYNTTTGTWSQTVKLYGSGWQQLYGKAFGLGDLEAALTNPPIEIGNRVWLDTDRDGQQDAGEPGLGGISVSLCTGAGVLIATTTTDTNGQYVFSSASTTALQPNTAYQVKFPTILAAGRTLTTTKTGSNTATDSDPSAAGVSSLTTDGSGNNVHTFDAGYTPAQPCLVSLSATPGTCQSATNSYVVTGTVRFTATPGGTLIINDEGTNTSLASTTISVPANASSVSFTLTGLVSGGRSHTLTTTPSNAVCGAVSLTYLSPVSCTAVPCLGTNLLQNPSFEQGFPVPPTGQQFLVPPPGWTGGTGDNNPTADFAAPDGYAFGFSGDNNSMCQSVSATAGGSYTLQFFAGVHVANGQTVTLSFLNSSSAVLGSPQTQTITHLFTSNNMFGGPYTLSGVAPAGTTQVRVCAVSSSAGTGSDYWSKVDNFCLTATPPPVCGLSMTVTPGLCQSANNTYTLSGQVSATNVPGSGTLTVSSVAFSPAFTRTLPAGTSSGTFSFSGLVSNGQTFSVTASFSNTACAPVTQTYAAPASCSVAPVCSLTVVPTAGICQTAPGTPAANTYSSTVTVRLTNAVAGVATISDGASSQTVAVASNFTSVAAIFGGLPSDGSTRIVSVSLAGCGSSSATYSAPVACSVALPCSASLTVTAGLCVSATNTYSATATLLVQNGTVPQTVTITVGGLSSQPITLSAGTASVTFEANGLIADGAAKTATVLFSGTACGQVSSTYSAPVACSVAPLCSASLVVTKGVCNSVTNTYSATATLTVTNPATGSVTLTVAGQSQVFSLTAGASNTIGFVANNLNSDGLTKTATALFSGTACGQTSTTFAAPLACTVCSLMATPTAGLCQTAANTFSSTVVVQISTTGAGGVLTVTDGSSSLTLAVPAGLGSFTGTATFNNLPSNGTSRTVTATLPGCSSMTTTYTAPVSCSVAPICSVSATASAGVCQTTTGTYSSTVVVVIQNTNSGGTLTITDGPLSQTTAIGAGFSSFTATAIFNGLPSNGLGRTVTATLPGCSSTLANYSAPTSCSVGPELALFKAVSARKAKVGQVISYTVTLVNTGPVAATSIVVSDTYSAGISIVPNSATTSTGSFTPDFRGGMWAIASLPAGATATLTFSASVLAEGIVYNSARTRSPNPDQPDLEVQVCTTVPFTVCKGTAFAVELSAPAGFDRYQWYFTAPGSASSVQVSDGTLNSYTATQAGDYELVVNDGIGSRCAELSCCPITVEETEVPSYTALTRQPTCTGTTPQANGQITLTNLGADPSGYYYQISPGGSFSAATATPATATTVPANGILASNLAEGSYTVRVWVMINGTLSCPRDLTVTLTANCVCKPVCVPVSVRKTTRP